MTDSSNASRPARTVLEQLIRQRRQTYEEFAEYAETFAREHNEPGTLSLRHLQRLAAGKRTDGSPLGPVRPATARLLERIFGTDIDKLLSVPPRKHENGPAVELHERLRTAQQVDSMVISLLYEQLSAIRRLDRQLGATVAYDEVQVKIAQVERLLSYSLSTNIRTRLAALLAEFCMLAGWQALDLRKATKSWQHYERAKSAACESHSAAFEAHTAAQQAFVLIDIDQSAEAAELLANARVNAANSSPALLRSWLAAAHGEALAASKQRSDSLRAFEDANNLLPVDITTACDGPHVTLDSVHLNRWHGHALAQLGAIDAVSILSDALARLDPSFTRAETALRVDLAIALTKLSERDEARLQVSVASRLAETIGSARQRWRIQTLVGANTRDFRTHSE